MVKKYGKYTADQLLQLSKYLRSLPELQTKWQALALDNPTDLQEALKPPFFWSAIYELSFLHQSMFLTFLSGMAEVAIDTQDEPDPQQHLLDIIRRDLDSLDDMPDFDLPEDFEERHLIGAWYAQIKTIECIWYYGVPLNDLVANIKDGDDTALIKAVKIDRSIVSCPPIADRIARAEMVSDEKFFKMLQNALKGKPKKPTDRYGPLRYILMALDQEEVLDQLSINERYILFCEELGLYPHNTADPARSLHQFIQRWKSEQST
ncbi:MAG: hypothetical protein ABW088_15370 [Sedimenticola sp.]